MLHYRTLSDESEQVDIQASRFRGQSGVEEIHLMLVPGFASDLASEMTALSNSYRRAIARLELPPSSAVFRRVFLSDAANQMAAVSASTLVHPQPDEGPVAVSVVEQPPLPKQRIALWAYHVHDPRGLHKQAIPDGVTVQRGEVRQLWATGLWAPATGEHQSRQETTTLLEDFAERLRSVGATLADHAVRTWFFVQNVDFNYQGLVRGRTEVFKRHGLTPETHYLASTGIEGRGPDTKALVRLDAYAVAGLQKRQVRYLSAPNHLGPANLYGVTFERGTQVDYRDRRHILISGTASIEPSGRSLHLGQAVLQAQRACENVEALLADAQSGPRDVVQMIVYLRDGADWARLHALLAERYPGVPCLFVRAPVCRPEWLVEIECLAIRENDAETLPAF